MAGQLARRHEFPPRIVAGGIQEPVLGWRLTQVSDDEALRHQIRENLLGWFAVRCRGEQEVGCARRRSERPLKQAGKHRRASLLDLRKRLRNSSRSPRRAIGAWAPRSAGPAAADGNGRPAPTRDLPARMLKYGRRPAQSPAADRPACDRCCWPRRRHRRSARNGGPRPKRDPPVGGLPRIPEPRRRTCSRPSGCGTASGSIRQAISPSARNGSRLVHRIVVVGDPRRIASARRAASSIAYSQLSRTTSNSSGATKTLSASTAASSGNLGPSAMTPTTARSPASVTSTNMAPSAKRGSNALAQASERVVLPIPPGPTIVNRRVRDRRSDMSATSVSRPIVWLRLAGRRRARAQTAVRSAPRTGTHAPARPGYRSRPIDP